MFSATLQAGVLVAMVAGFTVTAATAQSAAAPQIVAAPAFSAEQLLAPPRENWITNGGSIFNQRYSPLTQINRDNVAGVKALWRTSMGSGTNVGNSGQTQILEYDGTLYVSNGANDVFAIAVESGQILWTYHGNPDPKAGTPIGRSNRGVALGEGLVFVGQLDAKLVALDQRTGKVVWSVQAEPWQNGFSITAAPLYYDGMVIQGLSGGEMGVRGRVKAYDAKTGAARWTFYTIPGPGQTGHETWPQQGDAWQHGGAAVWQTPSVDPELGLIYFSTGNPGPNLFGAVRPGANLFTVSIVAIEAHTGKYRWHFQQIHHDIWDYDSPNPTILFDTTIKGRKVKGLVEVSKTGWAYILDRVTGKPLLGIDERAVPQEPRQATAATQPYPRGDAIVPQEIDIVPEGADLLPGTGEIKNHGRIFTPYFTEQIMVKPATMGGANWPPSSYDPTTHTLYVCATDRISTFKALADPGQPAANKVYMGGSFGQAQANDRGIVAALDVTTNKLVWRQSWREICYSGSIVTAGGLLFMGRADGRIIALSSANGAALWEFMTDAGVNTTATTFEYHGKQYVVVHAGGGVFANGRRGDGIWMFSLDGKIPSLAMGGAPAGRNGAGPPQAAVLPVTTRAANAEHGADIYRVACIPCHGAAGSGGQGGGPSLIKGQSHDAILTTASAGKNNMPAFKSIYSADELNDVTAYIQSSLQNAK